jgi:hypothetical protein
MTRKTEVYTWRLTPAMKASLEEAARREGLTVSQLLGEIVTEKLWAGTREPEDADRQRELHARADRFAGRLVGKDPQRAARARELVRTRLKGRIQRAP